MGISNWVNKLMGKSTLDVKKVSEQMEQAGGVAKKADTTEDENPIEQDFQKLSASVKDVSSKLKEKVEPAVTKQKEKATSTLGSAKKIVKKGDMKKVAIIFVAILALFVITIVATKVAPSIKKQGSKQPEEESEPTPTPATFDTYQPSIYADDPEVLKLEEDIAIYEREVSTLNLRHSELFPPSLDFNIKF